VDLPRFYHEVSDFLYELVCGFLASFLFVFLAFIWVFSLTSLDSQGFASQGEGSCRGVEKSLMHFPQLIPGYGVKFLMSIGMLKVIWIHSSEVLFL